ncbi:MAG: membrane dipeptidase [Candidatus Poribacteria bacterium]|nr:membrane dipeptidase [Candidatus Poribacteria bacterium]
MKLIFDGHLDLAVFALAYNRDQTESVAQINAREADMTDALERGGATVSLPEMRRAGVAVCQSSIAVRANREIQPATGHRRIDLDYGTQRMAYAWGQGQLAYYRILEQQSEIKLIRTSDELDAHWQLWQQGGNEKLPVGIILSMECADPIVEPSQAEAWWEDGLRSVMLAHFGKSHYAFGTGVSGPLTARGIELLKEFERIGMILDLTHLSDPSFYEALDRFSGPVIASHNNCRALVTGDRQFSDDQIEKLIERGAVIGATLDAWMLVPGWVHGESSPENVKLTAVVDHIDHVCQLAGNTLHAAIGTDTGATYHMPSDFIATADLQKLATILADRGYGDADIDNIFHGNWLRFFRQWLPNR